MFFNGKTADAIRIFTNAETFRIMQEWNAAKVAPHKKRTF